VGLGTAADTSAQTGWAGAPLVSRWEWGLAKPGQGGQGQGRLVGTTQRWVEDSSDRASTGRLGGWKDLSGHLQSAASLCQEGQSPSGDAGTGG